MTRRDPHTLDLFDHMPALPPVVARFEERVIGAANLRDRIAQAVSATLRDMVAADREQIAQRMSDWLGEDVPKSTLDAYSSQARSDNTITYLRLLALVHATGDRRLLQLGADLFGLAVVDQRHVALVHARQARERAEELLRFAEAEERRARGGRP